jgi:hypothetical protein
VATRPVTAERDDTLPAGEAFTPPGARRTILLAPLPCLVPLVLWAIGAVPAEQAVAAGGILAVVAGACVGYVRFDLRRCCRLADDLLVAQPGAERAFPLARWRAVIREAERPARLTWSPLNRTAARANVFLLRRLEQALGDLSRPVSPGGMLGVRQLLADAYASPLYRSDRADALPDALTAALAGLDARER